MGFIITCFWIWIYFFALQTKYQSPTPWPVLEFYYTVGATFAYAITSLLTFFIYFPAAVSEWTTKCFIFKSNLQSLNIELVINIYVISKLMIFRFLAYWTRQPTELELSFSWVPGRNGSLKMLGCKGKVKEYKSLVVKLCNVRSCQVTKHDLQWWHLLIFGYFNLKL